MRQKPGEGNITQNPIVPYIRLNVRNKNDDRRLNLINSLWQAGETVSRNQLGQILSSI